MLTNMLIVVCIVVCKHLVQELEDELERSGKSNEIFRTGQIFQEQRKEIDYRKS